jgi:uncharacterized membrane protein YccC
MISLYVVNPLKLLESYWAPITTLLVSQSSFGDTLTVSGQRFGGTALGAFAGVAALS